ncbi:ABC transporter permease [soil metagenome]
MKALFKKEIQFYLNNPIGYITIILFAVFANFLFIKDIFVVGVASMRSFFETLPWLLMIFIPALAMRSFADEKKNNTIDILLSLPISELQIVLAKFFAVLTIAAIGLGLTLALPISLYVLTHQFGSNVYIPEILVGYLGVILLSGVFVSVSIFYSIQTKNQVIAFLLSVVTLFFLIVFSGDFVSGIVPRIAQEFLSYLSPVTHLSGFIKGVIDLRSIYYFISFTVIFIFLTIVDLEKRP